VTSADRRIVQPGSLVQARGRDWVVLPDQEPDVVRLRPLTGRDEESIGLFLPIEERTLRPSTFLPPDPVRAGDATGGLLLRDAVRLNLRDGAAPFRSLGHISVTPRPYQFVPLIMALRLDPVRLLIADDVGVGKTIEAAMIARELLDRGLAKRLAVICPAHLCDQWEAELREKFAIAATVIQPSRIARLERGLPRGDQSIYQYYRHLVISIDFVKSPRNRGHFLDNAPDLIIVDEAHTAARPGGTIERPQQQRYELLRALADQPQRHMLLVTATPHSGIDESFRSLLGLLDKDFDLNGRITSTEVDRRALLPHVVQRRRSDLARWPGDATPFPERRAEEQTYSLSLAYKRLFEEVLSYCRDLIKVEVGLRKAQQRVRYWAAIALLRCLLSSPDAAIAVLAERAKKRGGTDEPGEESAEQTDALYRPQVLDPLEEENAGDYVPSAPLEEVEGTLGASERRQLAGFLKQARELAGSKDDTKLQQAAAITRDMLREEFRPIIFCRYIATAKYLAAQLPKLLGREFPGLRVVAVTGEIGDEERRERVEGLAKEPMRVLVATDCLSEGINLQDDFDAILHYDLPWNPNRLEQREGRVDRFGQRRSEVRAAILYGADNPVDLVVLDVLIHKARAIRRHLGIALPVPVQSEQVVQAVIDSVLLRGSGRAMMRGERRGKGGTQLQLPMMSPEVSKLHAEWDAAAAREQREQTFFRQHGIKPDEVARELDLVDPVLGDADAVGRFIANAAQRFGGALRPVREAGIFELTPGELEGSLRVRGVEKFPVRVTFDRLALARKDTSIIFLGRTHPIVAAFCDAVLGRSLSPDGDDRFARCGAIFTDTVQRWTGVALLRVRYLLREAVDVFAEEVVLAAFERREGRLVWLEPLDSVARDLLAAAQPTANMPPGERRENVQRALDLLHGDPNWFQPLIDARKKQIAESHTRLRKLVKAKPLTVDPRTPPDILGCYILVPVGGKR